MKQTNKLESENEERKEEKTGEQQQINRYYATRTAAAATITTTTHVPQDCLNPQRLTRDFWPEAKTMQSKLYGTIGDQRRTASFITTTGLPAV